MSVVFTVTAARADGFDINFANFAAAGAIVYLELNRAADFASDDTLQVMLIAANAGSDNNVTINGLPNATPFFLRMSNPSAGGAYSGVQHHTTTALPADGAFPGYSIDPAMVVVPADLSVFGTYFNATTGFVPGFPVENLLRDDPQSTFQIRSQTGELATTIVFETSGEPIDTIAILGTMAGADLNLSIATASGGLNNLVYQTPPQPFRCSPKVGRRQSYHALVRLPEPRTEKLWHVQIGGWAHHFLARNIVLGLARQSHNASKGHGEAAADLGTAGRNRFGVIDGVPGWRGRTLDFELSWLREAEYHTKWADLPGLVGTTKSVLALANPKRNLFLQDRFAFGPLTSFRAETPAARRNTVTVEINSLY